MLFVLFLSKISDVKLTSGIEQKQLRRFERNINWNNGMFKCLDGKKKISISQINDDYSDCSDGSDEPSTSVSSESMFYCKNDGFIPKLIPKWSVNDGICDCCDGSDEQNTNTTSCANTCLDLSKKVLLLRTNLRNHMSAGIKLKFGENIEKETRYQWLISKISENKTKSNNLIQTIKKQINKDYVDKFAEYQRQTVQSKLESARKERNGKNQIQENFAVSLGRYKVNYRKDVTYDNQRLGRFSNEKDGTSHYVDGEYCWIIHGSKRTDIDEFCWDSNKLVSMVEYSNCKYKGVLLTPHACNKNSLENLAKMTTDEVFSFADMIGFK